MTISLLNEVRLNDLYTRSPALFSTLPFVATELSGQPANALGHQSVAQSDAVTPTHRQFEENPKLENLPPHSSPQPAEQVLARPIQHDLMGQDIPSSNSITIIAGLTERQITPPSSIALYEIAAQPTPVNHTAVVA